MDGEEEERRQLMPKLYQPQMSTNFAVLLHFDKVFSFGCVLFIFILCRKKKKPEKKINRKC